MQTRRLWSMSSWLIDRPSSTAQSLVTMASGVPPTSWMLALVSSHCDLKSLPNCHCSAPTSFASYSMSRSRL